MLFFTWRVIHLSCIVNQRIVKIHLELITFDAGAFLYSLPVSHLPYILPQTSTQNISLNYGIICSILHYLFLSFLRLTLLNVFPFSWCWCCCQRSYLKQNLKDLSRLFGLWSRKPGNIYLFKVNNKNTRTTWLTWEDYCGKTLLQEDCGLMFGEHYDLVYLTDTREANTFLRC